MVLSEDLSGDGGALTGEGEALTGDVETFIGDERIKLRSLDPFSILRVEAQHLGA